MQMDTEGGAIVIVRRERAGEMVGTAWVNGLDWTYLSFFFVG